MRDFKSPLTTLDVLGVARAHPALKRVHVGTYPLDALPDLSVTGRPRHLVFNLSPSTIPPGSHWVSIWLSGDTTAEVVCSLGQRPTAPEILNFLRRHASRVVFNTTRLQARKSAACGLYCLSHGLARARGINLATWLSRFTNCPRQNDQIVYCEFMREMAFPSLFSPRLRNWRCSLARACRSSVLCE